MPIRWYGPADPADPTYRHFERIVNLTLHAALFAAVNSGLWFVQELRHPWSHLGLVTLLWAAGLLLHGSVVVLLRPGTTS
ncbi:MAG TPA: 2TM domain-containing protein [Cyanobium sp.]|nr:2TM domain-containing protein [Cyanobium sp.]